MKSSRSRRPVASRIKVRRPKKPLGYKSARMAEQEAGSFSASAKEERNTSTSIGGSTDGGESISNSGVTPSPSMKRRGSIGSGSGGSASISDFNVMGKLGEGGFGTVMLAQHKLSGTMSAIKVLLKARIRTDVQAERVLSEAQALGEVQHPFIVSLHGAFQDATNIFFVLEYVGGGDLFGRLQNDGRITGQSARVVLAEVALALGHVHERGYMYRDLKSENVLVCVDGHVKLADFGLAKKVVDKRQERQTRASDGGSRRTMRHTHMIGTPDALAPEVMSIESALGADHDYGASVDWWGLGILASEMFTGLDSVLVASAASEGGRRVLKVAFSNNLHLRQDMLNGLPSDEKYLLVSLLTVDITARLGCSNGVTEVAEHPYFEGLDFGAVLAKQLEAPLPESSILIGSPRTAGGEGGSRPMLGEGRKSMSLNKIEQNLIEFLNTPASQLCDAASKGEVEQVRGLVESGTDPNSCDYDRRTALHLAASEGHLHMVDYLASALMMLGADLSPYDRWGNTPLDDAHRGGHTAVLEFLEGKGAVLGTAGRAGSGDPAADLCDAASKGDIPQLRKLVATGVSVDTGDYDKRTAMHLAASEGLSEVVMYLVDEAGADPSPVDRWGGTPLDDAMRSDHTVVIDFLKSKGARVGKTGNVKAILEDPSTELCDAAAKGDVARLTHLVNVLGVNVNEGDYDKRTAIHLAASEGLLEVVTALVLTLGADPSPVDRWGNTPLDDAHRQEHGAVASFLRANGGVLGTKPAPAANAGGAPTVSDLCDAACNGDVARLRQYVRAGLDPGKGDYDRRTALHLAASEGHLQAVTYLVEEAGAEASPVDRWGGTPLDDAIRHEHKAVQDFLRAKGAMARPPPAPPKTTACVIL